MKQQHLLTLVILPLMTFGVYSNAHDLPFAEDFMQLNKSTSLKTNTIVFDFVKINKTSNWAIGKIKRVKVASAGKARSILNSDKLNNKLKLPQANQLKQYVTDLQLKIPLVNNAHQRVNILWEENKNSMKNYFSSTWLIRGNNDNQIAASFMAKSPNPISIRPLIDPTIMNKGSDFPVRLYVEGTAMDNQTITAKHVSSKFTYSFVSDKDGIASIRLPLSGEWQLSFEYLGKIHETDEAHYSSLLFFNLKSEEK